MSTPTRRLLACIVWASAAACTGAIDQGDDADDPASPRDPGSREPPAVGAGGLPGPGLAATGKFRRLNIDEYTRTLFDLLEDVSQASQLLPTDPRSPFDNDYTKQSVSQTLITSTELLAGDATNRFLANKARRDRIVGCTPTGVMDADCLRKFITRFGRLAWRRSLAADDVDALMKLQILAQQDGDFYSAVDAVLRALLQDPEFLFRVEVGTPVRGAPGLYKLTGPELATRLAYFLWGSTPDDGLITLAENGGLDTPEGIRKAAADMLARPAALRRIARFHALWMGYEQPPGSPLASRMKAETEELLDRVIFDRKLPWQELLRSKETYVNYDLGKHYGITGLPPTLKPNSSVSAWVPYAGTRRQGLLSHATFLQLGVKNGDTSLVFRGKGIRERLFCQTLAKPANVDTEITLTNSPCKRDQAAARISGCGAGCHNQMDPIGLGLENYDAAGKYRASQTVDPKTGKAISGGQCPISGDGELDGKAFSGPAGLAELILAAPDLDRCATRQLYRFVMGRTEIDDTDRQFLDVMAKRIGDGDFRFDELVLDFVSSGAFGHRRAAN